MQGNNDLTSFLLKLETDAVLLKDYKKHPIRTMTEFGLSADEQALVLNGTNAEIALHLDERKVWIIRPIPTPSPFPGNKR